MKTGRSTGTTNGVIVSADLVLWEGGLGSHEVCTMGEGDMPLFARKGDSGAVVMVKNKDMSLFIVFLRLVRITFFLTPLLLRGGEGRGSRGREEGRGSRGREEGRVVYGMQRARGIEVGPRRGGSEGRGGEGVGGGGMGGGELEEGKETMQVPGNREGSLVEFGGGISSWVGPGFICHR